MLRPVYCCAVTMGLVGATYVGFPKQLLADEKTPARSAVEITLHPVAESRPALKHRLLPTYFDQTPGNAAPVYLKAALLLPSLKADEEQRIMDWLTTPLDQLPAKEVAQTLAQHEGVLNLVRQATRYETCDWQLPVRQPGVSFYDILLPELTPVRAMARLLALQARYEMSQGQPERALATLRQGYTLAGQTAAGPTLIHGLVGASIANQFNQQCETLVQQPKTPNLFWSLAALPNPLIDFRPAIELEGEALYHQPPFDGRIKDEILTPAEADRVYQQVRNLLSNVSPNQNAGRSDDVIAQASRVALGAAEMATRMAFYPAARRKLLESGRSEEELANMPPAQVMLIASLEEYEYHRDEILKWMGQPYSVARVPLAKAEAARREAKAIPSELPLAQSLLPALSAVFRTQARLERNLAVLQCFEAVRLYTATHNGKLPATLAETGLPIPLNPLTGESFKYERTETGATLTAADVPGQVADALVYHIRLAQ